MNGSKASDARFGLYRVNFGHSGADTDKLHILLFLSDQEQSDS